MNPQAYALLGITALVAMLVAVVTWALLRFVSAARETRHRLRDTGDSPLLAVALQDAVHKLRAQERAMTERAEASEALGTQIVNSLTAGLLLVDREGFVRIINPAGQKMLGVDASLEGTLISALSPAAAPLVTIVNQCLSTGEAIVRRTVEVPHANDVTHLGVTATRLNPSEGNTVGGVICLFSDLTAVIALEEQLRLKETLAQLGELTAGIAHEFRNGLATIHGYGKLIDPGALPAQYKPYIEGIRQETEALGQVVTNFLNFARPTQLAVTPVDVGDVIGRVVEDVRADAEAQGGRVSLEGQWGVVSGDELLLRQAFSNLARNAVEACAPAHVAPELRFIGEVDATSRTLRVYVTDNGPGIEAGSRERVFRPFFTTKPKGTGLGLALVQKIVVTHNGRVQALDGPDGRGTTMLVTLPLSA